MKISKMLRDVGEFHEAAGVSENQGTVSSGLNESRYDLLDEEVFDEYLQAVNAEDEEEIADALADIVYIALGSLRVHFGEERAQRVWDEVHRSNMAKCFDDGKFHKDLATGKILKPPAWTPPDIAGALATKDKDGS